MGCLIIVWLVLMPSVPDALWYTTLYVLIVATLIEHALNVFQKRGLKDEASND